MVCQGASKHKDKFKLRWYYMYLMEINTQSMYSVQKCVTKNKFISNNLQFLDLINTFIHLNQIICHVHYTLSQDILNSRFA